MTIQFRDDAGADLALPTDIPVGRLLPRIVDLVIGEGELHRPVRWRLTQVGGAPVDDALSLPDNGVRDGETLLLSVGDPPALRWTALSGEHVVAQHAPSDAGASGFLPAVCCVVALVAAAVALVWPRPSTPELGRLLVAATVAVAAAGGAVVASRLRAEASLGVPLSIVAVLFAAVAGILAVPAGSASATVLLASAVAAAVAMTLYRVADRHPMVLIPAGTVGVLVAGAAAVDVVWRSGRAAVGVLLVVAAVGLLTTAPRIAIALTGIAPPMPGDAEADVAPGRAAAAHQMLSALVIAASCTAAVGSAAIAFTAPPLPAVTLTLTVALVLMLRSRIHVEGVRQSALVICGLLSAGAGFLVCLAWQPGRAEWWCVLGVAAGAAALSPTLGFAVSPGVRRVTDAVDCVAWAALLPAACWVLDVFGFVRAASLR